MDSDACPRREGTNCRSNLPIKANLDLNASFLPRRVSPATGKLGFEMSFASKDQAQYWCSHRLFKVSYDVVSYYKLAKNYKVVHVAKLCFAMLPK
jgi:hypothetical protein